MTNKEAKKIIEQNCYIFNPLNFDRTTLVNTALDRAITALEQESILDKIRAEIENHCGLVKENHCKYCSYCNSLMGVREILEVVNKYKTEEE